MKNYLHDTIDILKYLLIGSVCGLGLNYVILHSPLPKIFPAYTDRISSAAFSVNIIYGILLYCIAAPSSKSSYSGYSYTIPSTVFWVSFPPPSFHRFYSALSI
jgi:hypothetical protein